MGTSVWSICGLATPLNLPLPQWTSSPRCRISTIAILKDPPLSPLKRGKSFGQQETWESPLVKGAATAGNRDL
jgi:hypothetical protein